MAEMTVGELVEKLMEWPPDASVARMSDARDSFVPITDITYYAAYDEGYVVID